MFCVCQNATFPFKFRAKIQQKTEIPCILTKKTKIPYRFVENHYNSSPKFLKVSKIFNTQHIGSDPLCAM